MDKKYFVESYLNRIKIIGQASPNLSTLRKIHKQHLITIPFENLDIIQRNKIELDMEKLFNKIIENMRGGICYELNGLLYYLLREVGFKVNYLAAKVLPDGNEFDHVFLLVDIDGVNWLADVGFGDNFLEPLKFILEEVQYDVKGKFKICKSEGNKFKLIRITQDGEETIEYIFSLKNRRLDEFEERCEYFETSEESIFKKKSLCSIEKENGRFSLTDDKLIITVDENRIVDNISTKEEYLVKLRKIFGINF